jgi:hypothetical protein
MNDLNPPLLSVVEMQRLISGELSLRSRLGYTALLLVALGMTAAIASLWLTEPALPLRTHIAFAAMVGIGLSWTAYAGWVLTRRRVLLAGHRVIAARMAVTFTATFMLGSAALGIWSSVGRAAFAATGLGALMLMVAAAMLFSARRRFDDLMQRRRRLEQELSERSR